MDDKSEREYTALLCIHNGTTSNPKGCPLSHSNMMHATKAMTEMDYIRDKDKVF